MRRYKLVVHILFTLSVFNFVPVLAAPIAIRELRKRVEEGQDWWSGYHGLTRASPNSGSMSIQLSSSSQHPRALQSTSNDASEVHEETTKPIQLPSSVSGEIQSSPYASGGTELPWYSSNDPKLRLVTPGRERIQEVPGTRSRLPPASSVRTKTYKWVSTDEIEPAPASATPSEPSGEIKPTSSNKVPPLWYHEEHQAQILAKQQKSQSKSFLGNLASKSKNILGNLASKSKSILGNLASKSKEKIKTLASVSKSLFREMFSNPKLQIRIPATASYAVDAAPRELQGTVQHLCF